jgi:alkylation response protein AidB-like acyl-CoA dehydrogenase
MDFDFSAEQRQIQGEARRFLAQRCGTGAARQAIESGGRSDRALWQSIAELGWTGITIPERYGGLGLGHLEACLIAEELGRVVAPVPLCSSTFLAAEALLRYGSAAQREAWLPKLANGETIATLALTESPGDALPRRPQCAVTDGRLSGTKTAVADGSDADLVIVLAAHGDSSALFLVAAGDSGVLRAPLRSIDPSRQLATLRFENATAERLGGIDGDGAELAHALLDRAAVMLAFEQIGVADACLEMARSFVLERRVFGRTLGSYQAIKHKLADVYVGNQIARSNAYYGAWALATDDASLPLAAALSRVAASQAACTASREALHVHGGMGFTWEADCHLYYRRAQHLALILGGERHWKTRMLHHARPREMTT